MWICSRCKQKFVNKNQSHSCGSFTVAGFLKGKSRESVALFHAFLKVYREIGPYELHPVKTRVALLTEMRFASINRIGNTFLDGHFVLARSLPNKAVIHRIDKLSDRLFVHHFRISRKSDINTRFRRYMKLAYEVGLRKHVRRRYD